MKTIVRTCLINLAVLSGVLGFASIGYLLSVRYSSSPRHGYYLERRTSISDCLETDHYRLSIQQSDILGKDKSHLEEYCIERASISPRRTNTYWDYHYYSSRRLDGRLIRFNDSGLYNSRNTPCSKGVNEAEETIWFFGGSTMQNMETSDDFTIANSFCTSYERNSSILNLGVGSFFAELEIAKLVNLYKLSADRRYPRRPDTAIFYDGYNDSEKIMVGSNFAGLPSNLSAKFMSAYRLYGVNPIKKFAYHSVNALAYSSLYIADGRSNIISNSIKKVSSLIVQSELAGNNPVLSRRVSPGAIADNKRLVNTNAYIYDQTILKSICEGLRIRCVVFLQPILLERTNPVGIIEETNFERYERSGTKRLVNRFYKEVRETLTSSHWQSDYYSFIDLSNLPNGSEYKELPFFYDFGHQGFYTPEIVGNAIATVLNNMNKGMGSHHANR